MLDLFAQLPPANSDQVMTGLILLFLSVGLVGALLGIAVAIKNLRSTPEKAEAKEPVTRGELNTQTAALEARMNHLEGDMKAELRRVETSLTDRVEEVQKYSHESFHKLNNALQLFMNRQAEERGQMYVKLREQMDQAVQPLAEQVGEMKVNVARLLDRMPPPVIEGKK